jgi:hypothetical protein
VTRLEIYLAGNPEGVWENSRVRFPASRLNGTATRALEQDLLADKRRPEMGPRSDRGRFFTEVRGEARVRIPVSYLLPLAQVHATAGESTGRLGVVGRCHSPWPDLTR